MVSNQVYNLWTTWDGLTLGLLGSVLSYDISVNEFASLPYIVMK